MDLDDAIPYGLLLIVASLAVFLVVGYIWPLADDMTRAYVSLGVSR